MVLSSETSVEAAEAEAEVAVEDEDIPIGLIAMGAVVIRSLWDSGLREQSKDS